MDGNNHKVCVLQTISGVLEGSLWQRWSSSLWATSTKRTPGPNLLLVLAHPQSEISIIIVFVTIIVTTSAAPAAHHQLILLKSSKDRHIFPTVQILRFSSNEIGFSF